MGPQNSLLETELKELEVSSDGEKVDHPERNSVGVPGSKDLADAVAGSVHTAISNANAMKILDFVESEKFNRPNQIKQIFWPGSGR